MNIHDVWNRGNNLVAVSIMTLSGFAFLPEYFQEDELLHKIDDGLLFLLGAGAFWWYRNPKNKYARSIIPVILVGAGFIIKLAALIVEYKDKEDVGDDFGGLILFLLASIFVFWLYFINKNTTKITGK